MMMKMGNALTDEEVTDIMRESSAEEGKISYTAFCKCAAAAARARRTQRESSRHAAPALHASALPSHPERVGPCAKPEENATLEARMTNRFLLLPPLQCGFRRTVPIAIG